MASVRAAGLLEGRPWYYVAKIGLTLGCYGLGWALFVWIGDSWATLGSAALIGILSTQVVFLGHDAGHQQIARTQTINRLLGLTVGNLLTGVSFAWWVPTHNAHHAYPNHRGRDPDLGEGFVAFTTTTGVTGEGPHGKDHRSKFRLCLVAAVLLLQGIGLRITSIRSALRRGPFKAGDAWLLLVHSAIYLTTVFWVLPPTKAFLFLAIQNGVSGLYLGCSFAPNHKGLEIFEPDAGLPFVRRQILTSRNVMGGKIVTLVLGGLNYQIEHHLFPMMPRPNLAKSQRLVRSFCADRGIPYREDRVVASYRQAFGAAAIP